MKIKRLCEKCNSELELVGDIGDKMLYQCPQCKCIDIADLPRLCDAVAKRGVGFR